MLEPFLFALALLLGGGALYLAAKNRYERAVARKRAEGWVRHLTQLKSEFPNPKSPFATRHGEKFVLTLKDQNLVESRRGTRVSSRSSDAFTVALARGFYYTAASGRSVSPEPGDELRFIDSGDVHFTTHRVVFVGSKQTREWDFAKLLGTREENDGLYLMLSVSNRQKTSGIASESLTQISPSMAYQITEQVIENGFAAARQSCEYAISEILAQSSIIERDMFISKTKVEEEIEQWKAAHPIPDLPGEDREESGRLPLSEFDAVGLMFHRDSFSFLREKLKTEGGTEHFLEATLTNEPENEYSQSGKAVMVSVSGEKVGYVPEWLAPKIFDRIAEEGDSLKVGARLFLDSPGSKPQENRLTILLDSRIEIF